MKKPRTIEPGDVVNVHLLGPNEPTLTGMTVLVRAQQTGQCWEFLGEDGAIWAVQTFESIVRNPTPSAQGGGDE